MSLRQPRSCHRTIRPQRGELRFHRQRARFNAATSARVAPCFGFNGGQSLQSLRKAAPVTRTSGLKRSVCITHWCERDRLCCAGYLRALALPWVAPPCGSVLSHGFLLEPRWRVVFYLQRDVLRVVSQPALWQLPAVTDSPCSAAHRHRRLPGFALVRVARDRVAHPLVGFVHVYGAHREARLGNHRTAPTSSPVSCAPPRGATGAWSTPYREPRRPPIHRGGGL